MVSELSVWLHNNPFKTKQEAKPHSDAILQQLLQNSLNTSKKVNILTNKNGKPYISQAISFSHTNSANLYAYVISKDCEVAIDLEQTKSKGRILKLAKRYFAIKEYDHIKSLHQDAQQLCFFELWTRKEAWCKLDGGNLWAYLKRSVMPGDPMKTSNGKNIFFKNIKQIKGFVGCIASTQKIDQLNLNSIGKMG